MKKRSLVMVVAALSNSVWAADFVDTARVVSSTPIYERVSEPRQECWTETVDSQPQQRSMGGAVVGGVAGGLLGSQVGGGSGKTAATAAGAIAGTMVGNQVSNPDSNRSSTGAVIGGIAGGLLGSQVGRGSGRNAAAAAGAIVGTIVGDRVANPDVPQSQQVQRCRQVDNYRDRVNGYNVVYRYNGREFTTRLPYQPGSTLQLGVSLNVLDDNNNAPPPAMDDRSYRGRGDGRDYRRDRREED